MYAGICYYYYYYSAVRYVLTWPARVRFLMNGGRERSGESQTIRRQVMQFFIVRAHTEHHSGYDTL